MSQQPNIDGVSENSLLQPSGVFGIGNKLYIADSGNNRVLLFFNASYVASQVYGQGEFC